MLNKITLKNIVVFLSIVVYIFAQSNVSYAKKETILFPVLNYQEGIRLHKQGDLKNAIVHLNNGLTINPNDLPTLIELGQVFLELSRNDLAISTFKRAVALSPSDTLIHVLLGNAYMDDKKYKEATSEFQQAIKLEPDNILLRVNLGLVCSLFSDYNCTVDNLGKVVIAYPFQLKARAALGSAYHSMKDYALAKEQYKFVLGYEPDNLTLWYNLAKCELALDDYANAKVSIDKAISIDPSVVELYLDKGLIHYNLNELKDAEDSYLTALKIDPSNPSIPAEYGNFMWRTGAYSKAAEQYDKALALEPDNKSYLLNAAYLLQLANQNKESIVLWEKIIADEPDNKIALFNLAKIYQDAGSYSKAIELYKKLSSNVENPNSEENIETKSALAYCLQKNQNLDEAKVIYEEVLKIKPENSLVLYNLGVLLNDKKDYQSAILKLEDAIKNKFINLSKAYQALALSYSNLNDTVNLKSTYKKWLEIDANNIEARISYAKFLAKSGSSQEAIDQYRVAVTLDSSPKARFNLAQFLLEQKDLFGAVGQLQEYLKIEPNDLNALILLANAYKDLGIDEEAINYYKKITSIQYDNHLAYYNLGLLYQKQKKYDKAQNYYLKAIELNEKYSPAYYALGLTYVSENNIDKARDTLQKYLQVDPTGEYKNKVEEKLKELFVDPPVNPQGNKA